MVFDGTNDSAVPRVWRPRSGGLFREEAEAVPVESEVFCRSDGVCTQFARIKRYTLLIVTMSQFMYTVHH